MKHLVNKKQTNTPPSPQDLSYVGILNVTAPAVTAADDSLFYGSFTACSPCCKTEEARVLQSSGIYQIGCRTVPVQLLQSRNGCNPQALQDTVWQPADYFRASLSLSRLDYQARQHKNTTGSAHTSSIQLGQARPGSISTAGPTLAPCRVTWMCLHLSAHCCEMRHSLKLARCLQLEQDWCRLKTAHGCAGLSCRASLSHEIAPLTEADRTRTGRKQLLCRRRAGSALSTASMLSYCVFKDIPWEMIWKNLQTWSITDQRQEHIL